MTGFFKDYRPILYGCLGGLIFGILQILENAGREPGNLAGPPLFVVVPFGLLGPPFLVLIQIRRLRNNDMRWYAWLRKRVNSFLLMGVYGVVAGIGTVIEIGSLDGVLQSPAVLFIFSAGIGFLFGAWIEMKWGQPVGEGARP
ncbi:MAG: hypothetical protein AAGE89_04700 [Pseudomonadota bacterium]